MTVNIIILILLIFAIIKQIKIAKLQQTGGGIDKCQQTNQFDRENTNLLKGILALFIMFHHLGIHTDVPAVSYIFSNLGYSVTGMFFFMSGYGVGISYLNKGRAYISGFLPKRLGKLLPIFLILTVIYIGIAIVVYGRDITAQIQSFLEGEPPLPNSWFIFAIIYFYLTFYVSCLISDNPKRVGLLLMLFTCIYIYLTKEASGFKTHWWLSYTCAPVGYIMSVNPIKGNFRNFICILIAMQLLFTVNDKMQLLSTSETLRPIFHAFEVLFRSVCVFAIVYSLGMPKSKFLALLGGISFEIYMTHGIPMEIGVFYQISDVWLILSTVCVAIVLSLTIKHTNKITGRLLPSSVRG